MQPEFLAFAHTLADASGEILRRCFKRPLGTEQKPDASPVTQADREVETTLRAMIEQRFPDHGIIGEEFGYAREGATYQWVLDPIDGTRAFIAGYPTFTTLIALTKDGVPLLGVIDQPILRERYDNSIARLDNKKMLAQATLATTSLPYYFTADEAAAFERVRAHTANTVIGGDGYGYAMLASGHIDLFIDTSLKPYDFCALAPVIHAAGGVMTDWDGKPLTLHSDGRVIAAGSGELHKAALAFLNKQ